MSAGESAASRVEAMGNLIPLALAAAFYPTLLAVVVIILTRPNPARLLAAFLIGGMLTSVLVGLIVLAIIETSGAVGSDSSHSISPAIDIVAGSISLAIAFLVGTGRPLPFANRRARRKAAKADATAQDEAKDPWTQRILGRDSLGLAFGLGIVLDLPSVWYLAALKDIAHAENSTADDIALVLLFNVIMFALIEIPLVFYLVAPERAAARVARFDSWARSHLRQIGATVAAVIGVYLLINGIAGLA
jgi:Sap, sulfolipid-1-addressing protein